jgi:hypothetical protein
MASINGSEIDNVKLINSEVDVFAEAEISLNMKIPITLKNLLIVNGFENEIVISNINDSDIRDIILFARNELHKIIDKEDLPKYYGIYWKNPSLFEVVPGHKHIISLLSEYYKKKLLHKDSVEKMNERLKKSIKKTKKSNQILQQLSSNPNHTSTSTSESSVINEEIIDDNLTSEESSECTILEENARIRKAIVSWTQGKVTEAGWLALRELFDNISIKTSFLDVGELSCVIKCFCGINCIISKFAKRNSKSKRWIYSNFQKHLLKKHIQNTNSSATKSFVNQKNRITDYVTKVPSKFSNVKIIHNIEFIDTKNVNKTSQLVDNTNKIVKAIDIAEVIDKAEVTDIAEVIDKAEVADIVEVIDKVEVVDAAEIIDKAEIIFDTVNTISTEDTDNRIIISEKNNEEHDIDCSVSDSSYVIDHNIDSNSNIPTCSSFKTASQCDKWKSLKYQRSERLKRSRETLNLNQNLITDYFALTEKISKIICHNFKATENLLPKIKNSETDFAIKDNGLVINNFLKKLLDI